MASAAASWLAQLTRLGGSRTAETAGTARNWATVNKLLALCDG
jgi:uncharacterized protein (DUF1697 family)